jgi:hypothetical protein
MINITMKNFSLKQSALYMRLLNTIKPVNAMLSVKRGRPLVNHLLTVVSLVGFEKTLGLVKVIITFLAFCSNHIQHQGRKGLVMYLKACLVILQQASGGDRTKDLGLLGVRFARNHAGYPRVIPVLHRERIRKGEMKIFRLWMTLFSLYRVIEFKPILKLQSITMKSTSVASKLMPKFDQAIPIFWMGLLRLDPKFGDSTRIGKAIRWNEFLDYVTTLRAKPFLINKSSAAAGSITGSTIQEDGSTVGGPLSTSPAGLMIAAKVFYADKKMYAVLKELCSITGNQWLINLIEEMVAVMPNQVFAWKLSKLDSFQREAFLASDKRYSPLTGELIPRSLGRLGFKQEAAGKLRVFAMVDPFTQWLLKPMHEDIFTVLRLIPQDGTENQHGPIHRLILRYPNGPYFSFDLSSATDRLPIWLQIQLVKSWSGSVFAGLWARLLVGRKYDYRYQYKAGHKVHKGSVSYAAGQPMGALSSWGMLALTHHMIVQQAAIQAGVIESGEWFDAYALLGDDIVIADRDVAREYRLIMEELGVEVGLAKSLISLKGLTLEFAKRTFHKGEDVSGLPFSEYWVARQLTAASLELKGKWNLSLQQYLNLFGFGYRAKGKVTGKLITLGQRLRHKVLAYFTADNKVPFSVKEFFSMKSISERYVWTTKKGALLVDSFVRREIVRIKERLDSPAMLELISRVKEYSTVNRDREFYGTLSRTQPRARKLDFLDLNPHATNWLGYPTSTGAVNPFDANPKLLDRYYHVMDRLVQTVYRETFFDVLVSIRELRNTIESALESHDLTSDDIDTVNKLFFDLQDEIANIPLPKELYRRVTNEVRLSNVELIIQWEKYSRFLRSTRSR